MKLDESFSPIQNENNELTSKLLTFIQKEKNLEEAINQSLDPDIFLNLTSLRANILSVCDIKKTDHILEINSSYGAVTKGLSKLSEKVICVDQSKEACIVNREFNENAQNVFIYALSPFKFHSKEKFDKIFIHGFHYSDEESLTLLNKMKDLLNPQGVIFLTAHNQYALKDLAGGNEFSKNLFSSVEGKTLLHSSKWLRQCILSLKLTPFFYYPFPDYEFTNVIYSEKYLPQYGELTNISRSIRNERFEIFNDELALNEAIHSQMFEELCNSYLIKCR